METLTEDGDRDCIRVLDTDVDYGQVYSSHGRRKGCQNYYNSFLLKQFSCKSTRKSLSLRNKNTFRGDISMSRSNLACLSVSVHRVACAVRVWSDPDEEAPAVSFSFHLQQSHIAPTFERTNVVTASKNVLLLLLLLLLACPFIYTHPPLPSFLIPILILPPSISTSTLTCSSFFIILSLTQLNMAQFHKLFSTSSRTSRRHRLQPASHCKTWRRQRLPVSSALGSTNFLPVEGRYDMK